jgi:pyruvate dehydrogenase complex dehydrogenase (E1) component
MPEGSADGIIKGMYLLRDGDQPMPAGLPTAAAQSDQPGRDEPVLAETDGPPPRETRAKDKETVKPKRAGAKSSAPSKRAPAAAGRNQRKGKDGKALRVQLLGSGTILREAVAAAELLETAFGVTADIWSCPSFSELSRDGFAAERWNRLHPQARNAHKAHVTACLDGRAGPAIAATDYVRAVADQIRAFMPAGKRYVVLGTDGYGRSDTRANLRKFFEVDRYYIAHAAIAALADDGQLEPADVARALDLWHLDPEKPNPLTV